MLGIFGGTFDPVHFGHLRSAVELRQRLPLDDLCLLPCHLPPHRAMPDSGSEHRLAMLKLACEPLGLAVDDREMRRHSPSYTVETLQQFRSEWGATVSLVWVMGADAFCGLESWHQWRRLPELAHLVVMARPGESLPDRGELAGLLAERMQPDPQQLAATACGCIVPVALTPYPISASDIRARLKKGASVEQLMPASVVDYIARHQLYR